MNLIDRIKKMPLGIKIACSAAAVALIAAVVVVAVLSRNGYIATTMRLLRVEGTVTIEDSKGGIKPVINNIRFQSGDALSTGSDGLASVGLDDTKIITLQNDSRAEFTKQGKHLELNTIYICRDDDYNYYGYLNGEWVLLDDDSVGMADGVVFLIDGTYDEYYSYKGYIDGGIGWIDLSYDSSTGTYTYEVDGARHVYYRES